MKRRRHRSLGSSLVELAVGLTALIPIVLVIFDLCVIVIGVQINDSTCREAARVAASGNPVDAQSRALAIVNRANRQASNMLSNFTLVSVDSTVSAADIAAMGTYGGPINGQVTVQTQVDVKPFLVQWAYTGHSPLVFRAKQTFPFTYVVPNTTPST